MIDNLDNSLIGRLKNQLAILFHGKKIIKEKDAEIECLKQDLLDSQLKYAIQEDVNNLLKGQFEHFKRIENKAQAMNSLPLSPHPNTKIEHKGDHFTISQSSFQPAGQLGMEPTYQSMFREDKLCGNCGVPSVHYRKYADAIGAFEKDGKWHIEVLGDLLCLIPDHVIEKINNSTKKRSKLKNDVR